MSNLPAVEATKRAVHDTRTRVLLSKTKMTSPRPLYFRIAFPEQVAVRLIALIDFVEHDLVIDVADVGDARSAINIVTRRKETR